MRRTSELELAQGLFVRQSEILSELHYYLLEMMFASIYDRSKAAQESAKNGGTQPGMLEQWLDQDERTRVAYRSVLVTWKKRRLVDMARTSRYFGAELGERIETISKLVSILERQVNAAYYREKTSRFYICDTQANGPRDDKSGVFLKLVRDYIETENDDFLRTELYEKLEDAFKDDYRIKFLPLHRHLGKQISLLSEEMIAALQRRNIGTMRGS